MDEAYLYIILITMRFQPISIITAVRYVTSGDVFESQKIFSLAPGLKPSL